MTQFTCNCKGVKQINNRTSLNMTFTFTICISRSFSSAREFQMGNFQKYWSQNVGQNFFVLDFFHGQKILKVDGRDGRNPQNREKNAPAGRFICMEVTGGPTENHRPVMSHWQTLSHNVDLLNLATTILTLALLSPSPSLEESWEDSKVRLWNNVD